ncbi:ATP-binding protein [Acidithiobacillus thiooxidans]|nr:ATP-binding protein [Acidithiobacillus thiooxidans]
MKHFPRPKLAMEMIASCMGKTLFGDTHNGLFLAAPRRTGKTTFLRMDLKPALEQQGVYVIYVDLWSNLDSDPGLIIADAIGKALAKTNTAFNKITKNTRLDKVTIPGVSLGFDHPDQADTITLTDALRAMIEAAKSPVALIIDEAQHALTSERGRNTMVALKSARDQINAPGLVQLMLIMSGSDRDKLLHLVHGNSSPFFGSQVGHMPELDQDFIAFIAQEIEAVRPDLIPVHVDTLFRAFQLFGNRPQLIMTAVTDALSPLADIAERFESKVMDEALLQQKRDEDEMENAFLALTPLGQAIVWRMLEMGENFRPYDAAALDFYAEKTAKKPSIANVQKTIQILRDQNHPMIWKSAMGEYSVSDAAMHRWYLKRVKIKEWPPTRQE